MADKLYEGVVERVGYYTNHYFVLAPTLKVATKRINAKLEAITLPNQPHLLKMWQPLLRVRKVAAKEVVEVSEWFE